MKIMTKLRDGLEVVSSSASIFVARSPAASGRAFGSRSMTGGHRDVASSAGESGASEFVSTRVRDP